MFGQSSRSLKIVLSIVLVILLAVLIFVFLAQRGNISKKTATVGVPSVVSQPQPEMTNAPVPEVVRQTEDSSISVQPVSPYTSTEDAEKQFKAIQDQVNAGTLSLEDAKKQLEILNANIAPPALPDTKK